MRAFVDNLNDPARIWEHAFRHQISEAARHILLVLTTLDNDTTLENVEQAFSKFYELRRKRFGFSTSPNDWLDGLEELDGNFIRTSKVGKNIVVSFHNPSVRDFMEQYLEKSEADSIDLLRGAQFYEQYRHLWVGLRGRPYPGITQAEKEFLKTLASDLRGPSSRTIRIENHGATIGVKPWPPSNESRAEFFILVADELDERPAAAMADLLLQSLSTSWKEGSADREDLVRLLDKLMARGLTTENPVFVAARQCLLSPSETIDDFRAAAKFCETNTDVVADADRDALKVQFLEFASSYASDWDVDSDPDWLREIAGDLEGIGDRLGGDVQQYTQELYEKAAEIESERAEQEPPYDYEEPWERTDTFGDDVQGMFDGLKSELRDTTDR